MESVGIFQLDYRTDEALNVASSLSSEVDVSVRKLKFF